MLLLQNLNVSVNNMSIINVLNLEIKPGEVHAIMDSFERQIPELQYGVSYQFQDQ